MSSFLQPSSGSGMPRGRPPGGGLLGQHAGGGAGAGGGGGGGGAGVLDNRPKGKMTAYAFFVQTCRQEFRRKHPDEHVEFSDFCKKCAERWKTMSEKEKRRFNQVRRLNGRQNI